METKIFDGKAKKQDQGAVALVLDVANSVERVSLLVVWALGDAFQLPKEDLASSLWVL